MWYFVLALVFCTGLYSDLLSRTNWPNWIFWFLWWLPNSDLPWPRAQEQHLSFFFQFASSSTYKRVWDLTKEMESKGIETLDFNLTNHIRRLREMGLSGSPFGAPLRRRKSGPFVQELCVTTTQKKTRNLPWILYNLENMWMSTNFFFGKLSANIGHGASSHFERNFWLTLLIHNEKDPALLVSYFHIASLLGLLSKSSIETDVLYVRFVEAFLMLSSENRCENIRLRRRKIPFLEFENAFLVSR